MRVRLWLAVALIACTPLSSADSPALDIEPAWNGIFRAGEPTELTVRVDDTGPVSRRYTLSYTDRGDPVIRHRFSPIRSNIVQRVLLTRTMAGKIDVSLDMDGEHVAQETVALRRMDGQARIVAVAASLSRLPESPSARFMYVAPDTLPRFRDSYRAIDALVIDAATFARLSDEQQRTLSMYAHTCGAIVLHRFQSSSLLSDAGCDGRSIAVSDSESELVAAVDGILPGPTMLPSANDLAALIEGDRFETAKSVALLFTLYLATGAVLIMRTGGTALVSLSLVVAATTWLTWSGSGKPDGEVVVWGDTSTSTNAGRYTSLLRLPGARRGEATLTTPERLVPVAGTQSLLVDTPDGGVQSYTLETLLMKPVDLLAHGALTYAAPFELTMRDGLPVVTNALETRSQEATLAFDGSKYLVPKLDVGAAWYPDRARAVVWTPSPPDRLFRRASSTSPAALLVRLGDANSFLMVRP